MAIPIPSKLVEFILLGPLDDRRQIQDSPILGDVWVEYGKKPAARLDLLIVPYRAEHPGVVAGKIDDAISPASDKPAANQISTTVVGNTSGDENKSGVENEDTLNGKLPSWDEINDSDGPAETEDNPKVAYLQGLVVARMKFEEVLTIVIPKTGWWLSKWHTSEEMKIKPVTESITESSIDEAVHDVQQFGIEGFRRMTDRMREQAVAWHKDETPKDLEHFRAV